MSQRSIPLTLVAALALVAAVALAAQDPAPSELRDDTLVADVIPSLPARIIRPGVYHVLAALEGTGRGAGIRIEADDVVIDLGDHRLAAGRSEGPAIEVVGPRRNVTVRRGTLVGWSRAAIQAPEAIGFRLEQVTVRDGGSDGMVLGSGSTVIDCHILENRGGGIRTGSASTVRGCTILSNGGDGLSVGPGSLVLQTVAAQNGGIGIVIGDDTVLSEVTTRGNTVSGIDPGDNIRLSAYTGQGQRN